MAWQLELPARDMCHVFGAEAIDLEVLFVYIGCLLIVVSGVEVQAFYSVYKSGPGAVLHVVVAQWMYVEGINYIKTVTLTSTKQHQLEFGDIEE